MDWINQNRLKTGLIVALIVLNVAAITFIWVQMSPNRAPERSEQQDRRPSESASVMKSALDLTDEQAARFTQMLADYREQTRADNDHLVMLKRRLADSLFAGSSDTAKVNATAKEIGETQARVEKSRFWYFREFLSICTPAQQEKLRPILLDLFTRRPPKEEPGVRVPQYSSPRQHEPEKSDGVEKMKIQDADERRDLLPLRENPGQVGPPSVDEKLSKYVAMLSLTADQERRVRIVLEDSRRKGEELRKRKNPDPAAIEVEKKGIKQEEDRRIREVLDERQQSIFKEMIEKREGNPR